MKQSKGQFGKNSGGFTIASIRVTVSPTPPPVDNKNQANSAITGWKTYLIGSIIFILFSVLMVGLWFDKKKKKNQQQKRKRKSTYLWVPPVAGDVLELDEIQSELQQRPLQKRQHLDCVQYVPYSPLSPTKEVRIFTNAMPYNITIMVKDNFLSRQIFKKRFAVSFSLFNIFTPKIY